MKHTFRIFILGCLMLWTGFSSAQTNSVRGFYLPNTPTWIGNATTETAILNYASGNAYNYITLYGLGSFDWSSTTKKNQLADFIRRAKTNYGITQIGAAGEVYSFFSNYIIPFNNARSSANEKIDVLNYEFEWWVSSSVTGLYCSKYLIPSGCACDTIGAWNYSWPQFKMIDSLAAANGLTSEYYFGWPSSGRMQAISSRADRILLHAYRTSDADIYQYSRSRLIDAASNNQSIKILPIFSAEPSFMGTWLNSNPITKPYQTYATAFTNETGTFKQHINLQGYQWFNYDYLPRTTTAVAAITASGPTTFCSGGSVTLTANTGTSYLWSPGNQTTQSITVSASGSYTVRVTNSAGASAISSPVIVSTTSTITAPTISASGPVSFCPGGSVLLTSSTASSYRWSNGATTQSITVTASGNYNVTITSGSCSATSTNTTVTVTSTPPIPTVTASGSLSICPGSSVKLSSSQAVSYLWSNGATTREIMAGTAGTYWVKAYGGPNCFSQSQNQVITTLTAPTKPTISASSSTSLTSSNSTVSLTSTSASSYLWSTGATTRTISVNTQGSYRVTVSNSSGCTATSEATLVSANGCTPPAAPTISLSTTSNVITSGTSVTLTASTANGYLWSNGATTRTITVNAAGTYTVRGYSGGSCYSTSLPMTIYVVSARLQSSEAVGFSMSLYPNPATSDLQVNYQSSLSEKANFRIADISGRIVLEHDWESIVGFNSVDVDVAALPRGIYVATIVTGEGQQTSRIILQ